MFVTWNGIQIKRKENTQREEEIGEDGNRWTTQTTYNTRSGRALPNDEEEQHNINLRDPQYSLFSTKIPGGILYYVQYFGSLH